MGIGALLLHPRFLIRRTKMRNYTDKEKETIHLALSNGSIQPHAAWYAAILVERGKATVVDKSKENHVKSLIDENKLKRQAEENKQKRKELVEAIKEEKQVEEEAKLIEEALQKSKEQIKEAGKKTTGKK